MRTVIAIQILKDDRLLVSVGREGQIPLTEIHSLADCSLPEPIARMIERLPTALEPKARPKPETRPEPKPVAAPVADTSGATQMSLL
jgi:hypothetical protein